MADTPPLYEIHIQGHLPARLLDSFSDLQVVHLDSGETLLRVQVADQSELYGLIDRLRDLNVTLIEIHKIV